MDSGLNYTVRCYILFLVVANLGLSYCRVRYYRDPLIVDHMNLMRMLYCCYNHSLAFVKMNHNMSLLMLDEKRRNEKEDSCS